MKSKRRKCCPECKSKDFDLDYPILTAPDDKSGDKDLFVILTCRKCQEILQARYLIYEVKGITV